MREVPLEKENHVKQIAVLLASCCLTLLSALAQEPGRDAASLELGEGKVTIDYGTPKLSGRNLDEMIKPGVPWRMGMNAATTLENSAALDFKGKILPPGKYTLFARADEKRNWFLLITNEGNPMRLDPASIVIEVPLRFSRDETSVEVLKILLERAGGEYPFRLRVAWGNYRLHTSFKAA